MLRSKIVCGIVICLISAFARSEQEGVTFFNQEDEAYALRIKYKGSATATISNAADRIVLTDDGTANSVVLTNTMSYVLSDIIAATNSSGVRNFIPEYYCSLSSDTLSNKLVTSSAASTTVSDGSWYLIGKMDSSTNKSYDVCRAGDGQPPAMLTSVFGEPGGTGNVQVAVYIDGNKIWQKVYTSPIYVQQESVGTSNIFSRMDVVNVSEPMNIYIGRGQRCHVRAERVLGSIGGTSGGGIGATFTQK